MKLPDNLITQINSIVDLFNSETYKENEAKFIPVIKGGFLYLNREENGYIEKVVRLKYTGDMKNWEFAIYRFSTESYDDDIFFPGDEYKDGTIEGALKAGDKAYPV